jgi:phosphatidylglycerophosphatase A
MPDVILLAFARVGIAGLSPVMPGTCGSAVAVAAAPFIFMPLPYAGRAVVLLLLMFFGTIASGRAETLLNQHDPAEVVIDEVLGQWVTLFPFAALSWWEYGIAFALFRLFDIAKPWPIRQLESLGGGFGIMIDDAAAGIYAMICLALLRRFL